MADPHRHRRPAAARAERPFAISRNPIFLGMPLSTLGLFVVLPNGAALLLTEALMQIQVRLQEADLT